MTKPKVYAVTGPVRYDSDFPGFVMDESGEVLYQHISSSRDWAKHDLAAGMKRLLDAPTRFPEGYELVYIEHWTDAPAEVQKAIERRSDS